ncbi:MAG: alpha/beta hydrolase [Acidobacteria bacterium]|nr:alpha/beta hydrolase [Acidobacteriota bacterium]
MRNDVIERLFSLFTSADRAEAIAGDLTQERDRRGPAWFWLHVARVTCVLWRNAAAEAPWQLLAVTSVASLMLMVPALAGAASVGLFPQWLGSPVNWVTLFLFWWGGAFWTGAVVVVIAPRRGMAACATLALIGEALLLAIGITAGSHVLSRPVILMFFVIALGVAVPLLAGAALARRRAMGAIAMLCVFSVASSASAQQIEWRDPSPHATKLVTVDTDVQLEVLDWGGSGPALVLLSGLGATAHQYDDLAQALTPRYRVIGVTRRGHRGSSAVTSGYGFARLAEDVARVVDAKEIKNPVVIGHSFAGEELHVLGARYATKIRGLVYVDAAFDRGDDADTQTFNAVARTVPAAPNPTAGDLASFAALRAYLERFGGGGPEGYLRTRYRSNADGTIGGLWAPDAPVRQAMSSAIQAGYKAYDPERIRVPALAIYAVPKSADDLMRRGSSDRLAFPELVARAADDAALRDRVEKLYLLTRERVRNHEKWFEAFAERGQVVELSGTHDLIISNPREVLQQIEAFVSSLPKEP